MSTLRLLNAQIGTSVTPSQNFTWYQPTVPDGSIRLGVGNSGATTKDMIKVSSSDVVLDTPKAITTPPLGDNSKLLATTDWVKQIAGNNSKYVIFNTNTTLDSTSFGGVFESSGNSNLGITLPNASIYPGGSITLVNGQGNNTTLTVISSGGSFYGISNSVSGVSSSITVQSITTLEFISDGTNWKVINGGGVASKTQNGYQRLPSGIIIQWGYNIFSTPGTTINTSFPITFPNLMCSITAFSGGNNTSGDGVCLITVGLSSFSSYSSGNNSGAIGSYWQAIGY